MLKLTGGCSCLLAEHQRVRDQVHAALKHGLAIGEEGGVQCGGHGGDAFQQREQLLVVVLQLGPLGHQRVHHHVRIRGFG